MKRSSTISITAAVLVLVVMAALPPAVHAAWDGKQTITLGNTVAAEFVGDPGDEVHHFRFYAPEGTTVKTTLKVSKGSPLIPAVEVYDADGALVRTLTAKDQFELSVSGWYEFRVTSTTGVGEYSLKTKGKLPKKHDVTTDAGSIRFEAVAGTRLNAQVKKAKGSAAIPVITDLEGPDGPVDLGIEGKKIKKILLAASGTYTLSWRDDGAGGDVVAKVNLKAPKAKKSFSFGFIEAPEDAVETPNKEEWAGSGHADASAEAFRHWDADGEISTSCAKCHSTYGFHDFLGEDGSTPGVVDKPAELGSTVECEACHNDSALALDSVTFPSGKTAEGLGAEAICMQCHQGRESGVSLQEHIDDAMVADDDTVSTALSFKNIHYFAAGATLYGGAVIGAYQYEGMIYDQRNPHVASYDSCIECHDSHTLERKISECTQCHTGVATDDDLKDIRMAGSVRDYDGDGDADEGIRYELETMEATLLKALQAYADKVAGAKIGYDAHAYPYYFNDLNGNGMIDPDEANYGNKYASWTARSLRAAYNYQFAQKDPGAFAHNPKYVIEFLYDSVADLDSHADVTVTELPDMYRNDSGHFDAGAEAFRHWDSEEPEGSIDRGTVSASCARCHSPDGFDFWAEWGTDITKPAAVGDGMRCETCHTGTDFDGNPARKYIAKVDFPSGVEIKNDSGNVDDSFLCMRCHKGRQSNKDVDDRIASGKFGPYSFRNVHYLPAGATIYGTDAKVGYEYDGKMYEARWTHWQASAGSASQCSYCHLEDHTFKPQLAASCKGCHPEAGNDIGNIRLNRSTDYNGNGNSTEPLTAEIRTFGDRLYAAILFHAKDVVGTGIVYDSHSYPYFFEDADNDGNPDVDGDGDKIGYRTWDAELLKSCFNYQYWQKEPGAWAHNTNYILQLLYDSLVDMKGDVAGLTRP